MNKVERLYVLLHHQHGKPQGQWRLWCKRPKTPQEREQVMMEAILTQRTNWRNVEQTMARLNEADIFSFNDIRKAGKRNSSRFALLLRPSGFYKQKAERLLLLADFVADQCGGLHAMKRIRFPLLRNTLLRLRGVGPETADSILLYALDKPVFVIDEYTRRFLRRRLLRGLDSQRASYDVLQAFFTTRLPARYSLFQDFHALIVIAEKQRSEKKTA